MQLMQHVPGESTKWVKPLEVYDDSDGTHQSNARVYLRSWSSGCRILAVLVRAPAGGRAYRQLMQHVPDETPEGDQLE